MAVDLLGPAANLLAYQVDKRLDGIAKAQVATRLAAVYLMDHKADKAVATIRDSQISGLPDQEMHERMLLEARAFAALKRQKLELAEDLEQIRFLEAGYRIGACLTSKIKDEINTPADLERARTTS